MPADFAAFIHFVFVGFIALFPVINPIGTAFIVSPYLSKLSKEDRHKGVKKIAFYSFLVCLITLITGHWILALFGLTVPVIQLAGGIMICKIGWDSLTPSSGEAEQNIQTTKRSLDRQAEVESQLFYPISFPITTGAGTISVLFTLSAHGSSGEINHYLVNDAAIMLAVVGICILIFLCYTNANKLVNYLGSQREKIVNSIMAFLIFCVGLQIAFEGITNLLQPFLKGR